MTVEGMDGEVLRLKQEIARLKGEYGEVEVSSTDSSSDEDENQGSGDGDHGDIQEDGNDEGAHDEGGDHEDGTPAVEAFAPDTADLGISDAVTDTPSVSQGGETGGGETGGGETGGGSGGGGGGE